MPKLNENYLNLKASYLFSEIAHRTAAYKEQNPEESVKAAIKYITAGGGCEDHPSGNRRCDTSAWKSGHRCTASGSGGHGFCRDFQRIRPGAGISGDQRCHCRLL